MIINQDEINKLLDSKMLIYMIGGNYLHESIAAHCITNPEDNITRIKIASLISPDSLLFKKQEDIEQKGLLSLDWIRKTSSQRPCLIIMVYDVRNKPDNISWKDIESSTYADISKTKSMDNYQFLNLIVLVYCSNNNFSFDNVIEEKERNYNIKKIIDPKNLFFINGLEGLKAVSKKINKLVFSLSRNYYKNLKILMKKKRSNYYDDKEKQIKYNIKLGILSQIKNKKINSKYFEEAYNIMLSLNYMNVTLHKFIEYKYVADWLFHQTVTIRSNDPQNTPFIIKLFDNHLNFYSKNEIYDNNKKFLVQELMWKIVRLENFARFLEELNFSFFDKSYMNFPGYYYLLAAYNYSRLNKIYPNIAQEIKNYDFKYDFTRIKIVESKYYAKFPRYYFNVDPLTKLDLGFDEYIYIKLYLCTINQDKINLKLTEFINNAQKLYKNFFLKDNHTMTIFFQNMLMNELGEKSEEKIKNYLKNFVTAKNIEKFPLLYMKYTNEYNKLLISENKPENYLTIIQNIINISSVRDISQEEEEMLTNILFADSEIQKKFDLPNKNKLFYLDYTLSNNNPKVFDSTLYQFSFRTNFHRKMNVHSITLVFNNKNRNKQFLNEELVITDTKPLNLNYNILVKPSDDQLKLLKVRYEIHPENTKNILIFEENVVNDSKRTIQLKYTKLNIIDFIFSKKILMSSNQFYKLDLTVMKKDPNIKISILTMKLNLSADEKNPQNEVAVNSNNQLIEFYTFDENGNIVEKSDCYSSKIEEIDHNDKIVRNVIFKLGELGNYTLKFEANYKVLRNEIYDDYSIFTYSENIQIDSVPVVSAKFEFNKDNYFNINNQNVFPAQNDIKFKVKLENRIDTEIKLKKIEIIPNDCDLQIHSSFCKLIENENLLNLFNENILILKSNSDITIPFNLKCSKNFTGNIGKVVFYWTDIRNNNNNLINFFEIFFPDLQIKKSDLEISYTTGDLIPGKNTIDLSVKIKNHSEEFKKMTFVVDNSMNFLIAGPVRKKVLIYPNDTKELMFYLIPLFYGNLKLPPMKIIEESINSISNTQEADLKSMYFVPEMINITGNIERLNKDSVKYKENSIIQ